MVEHAKTERFRFLELLRAQFAIQVSASRSSLHDVRFKVCCLCRP